ncbi:hypothetical protein [Microbacterium capsulatum]|uniref:Uncharacterized protein n=1 Tax=Microbacterium capsulatum TaxID=3041921 RepID=A0ABU0XDT9_9MICO|nr:hypothetical protein [Microbacterium sp. ASV81]MDQ4213112.1 hypothetical protein [Microbacterium sp. ASV81]
MGTPREWARLRESEPEQRDDEDLWATGYGVMGVPFGSGHVLALRRWTASSAGIPFTSIWHRTPDGRWRFYESTDSTVACSRWFATSSDTPIPAQIDIAWLDDWTLQVRSVEVDWTVRLAATPVTRAMSVVAGNLPDRMWHSRATLTAMQTMATAAMGVGTVGLLGRTPSGGEFDASPQRVWRVADSHALIDGADAGVPHPLPVQAAVGDFAIPQRGIFAIGGIALRPAERRGD